MTKTSKELIRILWQNGLFDDASLKFYIPGTYKIINRGIHNEGAVADFSAAQIVELETGKIITGGIRIDNKSSDWRKEDTINDPIYDNIVLHLVAEHDTILIRGGAQILSCQLTPEAWITDFVERFPALCSDYFSKYNEIERSELLSQLLDQRVERKVKEVSTVLKSVDGNWYKCAYICFMRAMGTTSGNKDEFEKVARAVDYSFISLHHARIQLIEAAMLGQTGYLDLEDKTEPDSYTLKLRQEFIATRNQDSTIPAVVKWSRLRVRPTSAPAASLVRAAAILSQQNDLFDQITEFDSIDDLIQLFNVDIDPYWQTHSAPSVGGSGRYGNFTIKKSEGLILNFVIPMLMIRSTIDSNDLYDNRAMRFYDEISAENYSMHQKWCSPQWHPKTAFDSQALIQLCDIYCKKSCTACPLLTRELRKIWLQKQQTQLK